MSGVIPLAHCNGGQPEEAETVGEELVRKQLCVYCEACMVCDAANES